jgi:hypothetical protein
VQRWILQTIVTVLGRCHPDPQAWFREVPEMVDTWRVPLNPRISREGSFLRTVVICGVGLVIGMTLAATGKGGFWATALIIGAVITPLGTAYYVRRDGRRLRWTWRTRD